MTAKSGMEGEAGLPARGAKAAAFAEERNEVLVAAGVALDAQEAVFEQTALQVIVELPLDECRERSAFGFEVSARTETPASLPRFTALGASYVRKPDYIPDRQVKVTPYMRGGPAVATPSPIPPVRTEALIEQPDCNPSVPVWKAR